ncbi:Hsp20/alpha crystallin family protein [Aspergillus homomorphus CBS 101889]|uniref:HSP20-like chaperone n=1 Tax=Aspergillus homomorphus (strain CBS 101889) TaxID=1450537 RepID=A0A395HM44_ASPHC|nr:HSP20-like chaperone [Aspergillus homomorphus CBS 101889]RAL08686.1 HSP20-like chaperone [Aspergillus homomorphus CBS 101889]
MEGSYLLSYRLAMETSSDILDCLENKFGQPSRLCQNARLGHVTASASSPSRFQIHFTNQSSILARHIQFVKVKSTRYHPQTVYIQSHTMAFFPRFTNDLTPLFQLLDDYDHHRSSRPKPRKVAPSFSPKIDIWEDDAYHLAAELPGVEPHNIQIEFSDPYTLIIKGNTGHNSSDEARDPVTKFYHKPTVEDENEANDTTTPEPSSDKSSVQQLVKHKNAEPASKYWVSERSTGEFHRAFTFPARVHQDAVKANLKNGVLSLLIPKEPEPKVKKIRIE